MIVDVTNDGVQNLAYWKAERLLVRMETPLNEVIFGYYEAGAYNDMARYTQVDGAVLIDVTDFVRAYPDRVMYFTDTNITRFVDVDMAGLINPAGVLIPEREDNDPICEISAPSVMLAPFAGLQIAFEMWSSQAHAQSAVKIEQLPSESLQNFARSVELLTTTQRIAFLYTGTVVRTIDLLPLSCEHPHACVEWVSFSGQIRRHVFDISKPTVETGDTVALANILNEWTEIKGRVDGFTLRLENLDRYDLWYYSDLITSSRVRVSIDGVTWYDVHVDESACTLPDSNAGKLSTLEIPVKFRKYDAVSL